MTTRIDPTGSTKAAKTGYNGRVKHKILLVYDDYAEMIRLQTDLMKIGFDVVGIVNEALLSDQLLSFHPEVVVTAGRGGKVSAPGVAQKLRENSRFTGKVILLLPASQRPSSEELTRIRMDALIEFPTPVPKLLAVMAKLLGAEAEAWIEKLRKAKMAEGAAEEIIQLNLYLRELAAEKEQASKAREKGDRASRYETFLKGVPPLDPQATTFGRQEIRSRQEKIKKDWDFKLLEEIDELKRKFAQALFKK